MQRQPSEKMSKAECLPWIVIIANFWISVRVGSEFWKQQEKFGDDLTGVQ